MNNKEPVVFKSEDSMWQMLAQGIKTWEGRRFDVADERIARLTKGHWEKSPFADQLARYMMDEEFICILNKLTDQTLQFRYRGFMTPGWAPGWCFLLLGQLVGTIDKDGTEIKK